MKYTPLIGKRPFLKNWDKIGFTFDEAFNYDKATGCGLLLGPISGGVMALDFDGPEAMEFYGNHFSWDSLQTAKMIWSSGREDRFQVAWTVPQECWEHLYRHPVSENEKLDFRWTGTQSVMPPSYHPDTKCNYFWVLNEPPLTQIPDELLEFWMIECMNPKVKSKATVASPAITYKKKPSTLDIMRNALAQQEIMPPHRRQRMVLLLSQLGVVPYARWIAIGLAMKSAGFTEEDFQLVTARTTGSTGPRTYEDAHLRWDKFKSKKYSIGTLIYEVTVAFGKDCLKFNYGGNNVEL